MKTIKTAAAPKAIGPYCQAITHQGLVFCSGQIALDPETMELTGSDIRSQTQQIFTNLHHVLNAAGSSMNHILKTTVFLTSMNDFIEMNQEYERIMKQHKPARSTVEVSALPKGARVEIECVAALSV